MFTEITHKLAVLFASGVMWAAVYFLAVLLVCLWLLGWFESARKWLRNWRTERRRRAFLAARASVMGGGLESWERPLDQDDDPDLRVPPEIRRAFAESRTRVTGFGSVTPDKPFYD